MTSAVTVPRRGIDPGLPTLAAALDPAIAERELEAALPALRGLRLQAVRLLRHRPGRRAVLAYDVEAGWPPRPLTLVAKIRRLRSGSSACRLLEALRGAGFSDASPDGVSVPEPLGVVRPLRLWIQRAVPGTPAATTIAGADGAALAARVAEAADKLHRAGVAPARAHRMADELMILHQRLPAAAGAHPGLDARIARLLEACDRLAARVAAPRPCGIHRDLHPDQVLVDGDRLWLLDFDLYCLGDPALDAGNFLGHLTEQALRELGDPAALADRESALEERFVALAGARTRGAVRAYARLTLVRQIALSAGRPGGGGLTLRLLELCEERFGLAPGRAA